MCRFDKIATFIRTMSLIESGVSRKKIRSYVKKSDRFKKKRWCRSCILRPYLDTLPKTLSLTDFSYCDLDLMLESLHLALYNFYEDLSFINIRSEMIIRFHKCLRFLIQNPSCESYCFYLRIELFQEISSVGETATL